MKNTRNFMLLAIIMNIFGAISCSTVLADITIGEITVTPLSPAAKSTISLSTTISGDTPSEVRVTVEECNGRTGICYYDIQNVSMSLINNGNYQTSVTLKHADATYITCIVKVETNSSWISSQKTNVTLSENTNGNTNGNNNDNNKTPGFELVLIVIAIGLSLIVIGRKR